MFYFDEEDTELILSLIPDLTKDLDLSEETAKSLATYEVAVLRLAEDINDELSERETANKLDNIRKVIVSSLIGFLYNIKPNEKLAKCTHIYVDYIKEKCSDSSKRFTDN